MEKEGIKKKKVETKENLEKVC